MYEIKPDILIKMIWFFPDFSNITNGPPTLCGYDVNTGEDKFCCKDLDPSTLRVSMPQSPLFPETNSGAARPCRDHSPECPRWAETKPDSCDPHPDLDDPDSIEASDHSYEFMREACMESCGRCQDKVR